MNSLRPSYAICFCNGSTLVQVMLPDVSKTLPEPMLTYRQWGPFTRNFQDIICQNLFEKYTGKITTLHQGGQRVKCHYMPLERKIWLHRHREYGWIKTLYGWLVCVRNPALVMSMWNMIPNRCCTSAAKISFNHFKLHTIHYYEKVRRLPQTCWSYQL